MAAEPAKQPLIERFLERTLAKDPQSLLDVGSGAGAALVADRGIACVAVDPLAPPPAGVPFVRAPAEALPFAPSTFDGVTLRHILHHLTDPLTALREARRVARRFVLVAEPTFLLDLPGQGLGERMERWRRQQQRALGMQHQDDFSYQDLAALCHAAGAVPRRVETLVPMLPVDLARYRAEGEDLLRQTGDDHARVQLEALLLEADRDAPTATGTVIFELPAAAPGFESPATSIGR